MQEIQPLLKVGSGLCSTVFWLIAVLLVGLGLSRLVDIFAQNLFVDGQFSLALFHNLFASAQTRHILITSLHLAGLVSFRG